jgi:hypothetical protein
MTSKLDKGEGSRGDRARARAYLKDFLPGVIGYFLILLVVLVFGDLDGTSPGRFLWALLPVIPAIWVVRALIRHLGRIDDFQRGRLLQGIAVGFAVAMISAITLGFLGIAGLDMRFAGWIIYVAGMAGWLIASGIAAARNH